MENDLFCSECGTKLKQGEINRINSGLDIACQVCGTEIEGKEGSFSTQKPIETKNEPEDLGEKIKKGIQSFVKGIKSFAESFDDSKNKEEDSSNEFSDE
ncbi:MAG: hypothetical protein EU530_02305 [Promethearchaeota archaeon]|nr:MAG: hypothetical protein EU530_02305 [Candidatus Lokiarchaeota archaeon]